MSDTTAVSSEVHPVEQLYHQVKNMFSTSNSTQKFLLEFPGRSLNHIDYHYKITDYYSELNKPQAIKEKEFGLSDDMFDLQSDVVNGGNGTKVSESYIMALNSIVPKMNDSTFEQEQEKIRNWLLEKVDYTDEKDNVIQISRIDVYKRLNIRYQRAKAAWNHEKFRRQHDMDRESYARWIATEAPVHEAELEALYSDLNTRGYYHKIKKMVGYLDVASLSELLEDVKGKIRASSMSSLDESSTIYPVDFSPSDWFNELESNFNPTDLLLDRDTLIIDLRRKQDELDSLTLEKSRLEHFYQGDASVYEKQIEVLQTTLDEKQTELTTKFSASLITAAKYAIKYSQPFESIAVLTGEANKDLDKIQQDIGQTLEIENKVNDLSRQLSTIRMKQASSTTADFSDQLIFINQKIEQLKSEVKHLEMLLFPADKNNQLKDVKTLDASSISVLPSGDLNRSMALVIHYSTSNYKQSESQSSFASSYSASGGFWFCGLSHTSSTQGSEFISKMSESKMDMEIGMHLFKVEINRGGWFVPDIFKDMKDMSKISSEEPTKIFNSYPISFIVAKDITIKINNENITKEEGNKFLEKHSSSSGGFFGFSFSSSSSSQNKESSMQYHSDNGTITIRIPQPQIIGWFIEPIAALE